MDEEDKTATLIQGTGSNYKSNTVIINENGLYSLILSSKLPGAKKFQRWVTGKILPSIRKNGGYIAGQKNMTPEELMAAALIAAQKTIENQKVRLSAPTVENQIMRPKADYFDKMVDRKSGGCNPGKRNNGNRNSGDCNSTNGSNGCFNTIEPTIYFFNQPSG